MTLRISTMTACSEIRSNINLSKLYENTHVSDFIKYVEHGDNNYKGYALKNDKKKRKEKAKKTFFNQVTMHCFYDDKIINVKFFNNGQMQMTGLKYEEQGNNLYNDKLFNLIKDYKETFDGINLKLYNYRIVLINSDFSLDKPVNRDDVQNKLMEYNYYSTYEPCVYPGVNIKYYFNTNNDNGICKCNNICRGKGSGDGDGECKRVTIAVFKAGNLIITGAKYREQLHICKNFITDFINNKI
jgi:TATA-box binding protein (TBP) (component of TFIID and TFIIIB)